MAQPSIAFIGAGNMATALIAGLIADDTDPSSLLASDPDPDKLQALSNNFGIITQADNQLAVQKADIVVLAVKPQVLKTVCESLAPALTARAPLIVSIAAGIRSETLRSWLGGEVAVVRAMPNTPAMVSTGATGLYAGPEVAAGQRDHAERILRAVGVVQWVPEEDLLDAVTAVSGSGPAYFFLFMEAIEKAAQELGLAPETARLLTLQTALGAAKMAMESADDPETLRHKVTSPGGTTERALEVMEEHKLRQTLAAAMRAASEKSAELSRTLG